MALVYSSVETVQSDAAITATLATSYTSTTPDRVRIQLGDVVLRVDIPGAVDLVDEVVQCLAQLDAGGDAA